MPGVKDTMKEFKAGTLHSGSKKGPLVKNPKQAIAIALSQERKAKGMRQGGQVPKGWGVSRVTNKCRSV